MSTSSDNPKQSAEKDQPVCVCGTLSDLGGPGRHHDDWCPLYRVTTTEQTSD